MVMNRYKQHGWFQESQRHSLARRGMTQKKSSGKKAYFADKDIMLKSIITNGNRVRDMKNSDNKGIVLKVEDGVATILTNDKRTIQVPAGDLQKQSKQELIQEVKDDNNRLILKPAFSNQSEDSHGEWVVEGYPKIGTGNVMDFKQIFGDKNIIVEGQQQSFNVSANNSRGVISKLSEPREAPEMEDNLR